MRPCSDAVPRSASKGRLAPIACFIGAMLGLCAPAMAQQFDYDPDGFWKMPSPPAAKGEFDGEDPIGLASRQHIPTDCAINWKDEAGKTYCFSSSMSSMLFQDERATILPKAVAFWAKEHRPNADASKGGKPAETPLPAKP